MLNHCLGKPHRCHAFTRLVHALRQLIFRKSSSRELIALQENQERDRGAATRSDDDSIIPVPIFVSRAHCVMNVMLEQSP